MDKIRPLICAVLVALFFFGCETNARGSDLDHDVPVVDIPAEAAYLGDGMELVATHGTANLVSSVLEGTNKSVTGSLSNIKDGNTGTYHRYHAEELDLFFNLEIDVTWEIAFDNVWWADSVRVYLNGYKYTPSAGSYETINYVITAYDENGTAVVSSSGQVSAGTSYIDLTCNRFIKRIFVRMFVSTSGGGRAGWVYIEASLYEVYVYGEEWVKSSVFFKTQSGKHRLIKHLSNTGGWWWDGSALINPVLVSTSHYLASPFRAQMPSGLKSLARYA